MRIKGKEGGGRGGGVRDRGRVRERICSHIQTPTCNILMQDVHVQCHECTLKLRTCCHIRTPCNILSYLMHSYTLRN